MNLNMRIAAATFVWILIGADRAGAEVIKLTCVNEAHYVYDIQVDTIEKTFRFELLNPPPGATATPSFERDGQKDQYGGTIRLHVTNSMIVESSGGGYITIDRKTGEERDGIGRTMQCDAASDQKKF